MGKKILEPKLFDEVLTSEIYFEILITEDKKFIMHQEENISFQQDGATMHDSGKETLVET